MIEPNCSGSSLHESINDERLTFERKTRIYQWGRGYTMRKEMQVNLPSKDQRQCMRGREGCLMMDGKNERVKEWSEGKRRIKWGRCGRTGREEDRVEGGGERGKGQGQ